MVDKLHVGTTLAGSPQEDGCTFIQRHIYTSVFMTTTHRYMKEKLSKYYKLCTWSFLFEHFPESQF